MVNLFRRLRSSSLSRFVGVAAVSAAALSGYHWLAPDGVSSALAQASRRGTAAGTPIGRVGNRLVYGHAEIAIPAGWKVETDFTSGMHVGYTFFPDQYEHFYDSPIIMTITPGLRDTPDRLEPFINAVLDDRELADGLGPQEYEAWRQGDESILTENNVAMSRERSGTIGDDSSRAGLILSNVKVIYNKRHVYIAQVGEGVGALIDFYVSKPEEMEPYFPILQSIIESYRFVPAAVTEVGSGDRLIGLYSGRGGYWLLYDNGRFASTPDNGYKIPTRCTPDVCGRFVQGAGGVSFNFDNGKVSSARIAGGALTMGASRYALAQPLAGGTPLSGLYKLQSGVSSGGAFGSVIAYTNNKFAFDAAGNFQSSEKFGSSTALIGQTAFGPRTIGGASGSSDGSNKGGYSIDGYILTLRSENGATTRRFIYRALDKAGRATIAIDGRAYERE
jgi:hypothetical protein